MRIDVFFRKIRGMNQAQTPFFSFMMINKTKLLLKAISREELKLLMYTTTLSFIYVKRLTISYYSFNYVHLGTLREYLVIHYIKK